MTVEVPDDAEDAFTRLYRGESPTLRDQILGLYDKKTGSSLQITIPSASLGMNDAFGAMNYTVANFNYSQAQINASNAAFHSGSAAPFPAASPQEEASLIQGFRAMALQTNNGRQVLNYIEKKENGAWSYEFTDGTIGKADPTRNVILLPRASWEDSAWTMIHEGVHVYQANNGLYSPDKGWTLWRQGEVQAYGAEINAYRQYRELPGNANYTSPGAQVLSELWKDQKAFKQFIDDHYRPIFDAVQQRK